MTGGGGNRGLILVSAEILVRQGVPGAAELGNWAREATEEELTAFLALASMIEEWGLLQNKEAEK